MENNKKEVKTENGNLPISNVIPRTVVFYIDYLKGVGIIEKKRMLETHPDIENEMYIYDNILPHNDEVKPYYEYVV